MADEPKKHEYKRPKVQRVGHRMVYNKKYTFRTGVGTPQQIPNK